MKKYRILQSVAGLDFSFAMGQVVTVGDTNGGETISEATFKQFLDVGYLEPVTTKETAAKQSPSQKATTQPVNSGSFFGTKDKPRTSKS